MASKDESILNFLSVLPWVVSVLVSCGVYVTLKYILPAIELGDRWSMAFLKGISDAAPLIAMVLLIPVPVSLFNSWRKR